MECIEVKRLNNKKHEKTNIYQWIFKSYLKTAVIPLVLLQLGVLLIFFGTNFWSRQQMAGYFNDEVSAELTHITMSEGMQIKEQLEGISEFTKVYGDMTLQALNSEVGLVERDRLSYSPDGIYYTTKDSSNGGAAIFYSGAYPIDETSERKVDHLLTLQEFMKSVINSNSLMASIYFNTYDSLNIIYPYFNVIEQYAPFMDIPKYNFYYEADMEHNPEKKPVWTDVYLDPAGHGWMVSSISPVYNGDFLEGVVGIDITVSNIVNQILKLEIPYRGYGLLVGKDGTILAMPPQGEEDFGLNELTEHSYNQAIMEDTFKPEDFNIYSNDKLSAISSKIKDELNGLEIIELAGISRVITWSTIEDTSWKILLIAEEDMVYETVNATVDTLNSIGIILLLTLLFIYICFVYVLSRRTIKTSINISKPLTEMNLLAKKIGDGDYYQEYENIDVLELEQTYNYLVDMGKQLGESNRRLLETQDNLRMNEANLKALVNSIDDILLEVNEYGDILHSWSRIDSDLLRISTVEDVFSLKQVLDGIQSRKLIEKINRVIRSGISETFEFNVNLNMNEYWFLAKISRVDDTSRRVVVSARDITQRMEMERNLMEAKNEAEKANRAKSIFLSNMSHELRTPLNAILGFAQILEMDTEEPLKEMQAMSVQQILTAGKHLLVLINEVLDLAKIESGKVLISMEPVAVKVILDETYSLIKPTAEMNNIGFTIFYPQDEQIYVQADFTRIKQILINLLTNAIKYNKPEGTVRLTVQLIDQKVCFHIIDSGIGIQKEELEQIFKPFYRVNNYNSTVEGTGIGLAVAKQLVELMDGEIKVESTHGVGSHFIVELHQVEYKELNLEHGDLELKSTIKNKTETDLTVVYVEDNPANLALIEQAIKQLPQVTLYSAMTGEEGIRLIKEVLPDIILLDINLPDINGIEVLRQLKKDRELSSIPFIAVSANAMERDIIYAKEAGFTDYITKPINVSEFLNKIGKMLGLL